MSWCKPLHQDQGGHGHSQKRGLYRITNNPTRAEGRGNARQIDFGGQADRPRQGFHSPGDRPLLVLRVEEGVACVGFDRARPIVTAWD
jgi:hypothetical protein